MNLEILNFVIVISLINLISFFNLKSTSLLCGLVGFSGKQPFNADHVRFLLFWNAEERNSKDATGIFTPKSDIVKDSVSAKTFITTSRLTNRVQTDNNLIGHVRAKTVGVNNLANAHPFRYDSIVMAHNGTLENHIALARMYSLEYTNYNVDSQVLAKCIAINTQFDDKIKVLEQYQGAAAIIYYNTVTDILYAYHDSKRPLFYGYLNKTEMYISSIKDSLEAIHCDDVKEFEIGTLYGIRDGEIVSQDKYANSGKSNFLEIITAETKDLVIKYYKKDDNYSVRSKVPNISGMGYGVAKPVYLAGYWIRCDSVGYLTHNNDLLKKNELLVYDRWYYVLGAALGKQYAKDGLHMEVKNTKGERGIITTPIKFACREFIPQDGKYVVAMADVIYTKSNIPFLNEGDMAIVKSHEYGSNSITITNLEDNTSGVCGIRSFRVATTEEVKKYLEELQKTCNIEKSEKRAEIILLPTVTKKPEVEVKKEDPKNLLNKKEDVRGPMRGYDDIHYDYPTICYIVGSLIEGHQEISNAIKAGHTTEAIELCKQFEDDMYLLFDPDVLDQMTPINNSNDDFYANIEDDDTSVDNNDESPFVDGESNTNHEGVVIMERD